MLAILSGAVPERLGSGRRRGVIGEEERPVGAAWFRLFSADEPGYGFAAKTCRSCRSASPAAEDAGSVPAPRSAVEVARADGHRAISLSVEPDNPARRLYERAGFVRVADDGGAWTMLLELRPS